MEQSPSALQDARKLNLLLRKLEASDSPKTSSTLKLVYQKVMYSFRKPRRKQSGITCLPPIEEELQASVNAIEEERRARVNEISVHHLVESTVDDVPASAEYSSARIHRMMRTRSSFSTDLEFEIESSKVHWSETVPLSDDSELVSQDPQAFFEQGIFAGEKCPERVMEYARDVCNASLDHKTREKQLMFMLQARWAPKFSFNICESKWEVGSLIAEGAQAQIFEANPKRECPECHGQGRICRWLGVFPRNKYIVKVFRKGYRLRDLQRLWPKQVVTGYSTLYTCPIRGGYLLPNGRFAFMMPRYWGDLCKLLDQRMQQRLDCTHPPCSDWEVTRSMLYIAKGMRDLHISNIVHRDLKASNVLVEMIERSELEMEKLGNKEVDTFYCRVADFESSKGVLGTGFWRAPEILIAVKNRCVTPDLFTKASDVYSYAMTCYEIWTGCLPFENLKKNEYDIVLGGERPILPSGLKPWIHEMLACGFVPKAFISRYM